MTKVWRPVLSCRVCSEECGAGSVLHTSTYTPLAGFLPFPG